eukprot:6260705-Prymnesium_polylepis.1
MELEAFRAATPDCGTPAITCPQFQLPSTTASQPPSVADAFLATLRPPPAVCGERPDASLGVGGAVERNLTTPLFCPPSAPAASSHPFPSLLS